MNLTEAYLLLAVMLAVVAVVSVLFKGKSGLIAPLIFVAGLITALVAGWASGSERSPRVPSSLWTP